MTTFVVVGVVVVFVVLVVSLLVTVIDAGQNKLTPCALRHSTSFSLQSNLALGIPHTRHIAATGTSRSRDWYHWDTTRRIAVLNDKQTGISVLKRVLNDKQVWFATRMSAHSIEYCQNSIVTAVNG